MTEKPPHSPEKPRTAVVRQAALEHYRRVRAGMNQDMLARVRDILTGQKPAAMPPPEPPAPKTDTADRETFERRKAYETVLKFMTLSKGSKAFMDQVAKSLAEKKKD